MDHFKLKRDEMTDFDRCNIDDLKRVRKPSSIVFVTPACKGELSKGKT